jgi:hypothetical protein
MRLPIGRTLFAVFVLSGVVGAQDAKPDAGKPEAGSEKPKETEQPKDAGQPKDGPLGEAGPFTIDAPPRSQRDEKDFVPFPDRWRIEFPAWDRISNPEGEQPYNERGSLIDPYHQNILKGDYPFLGDDWFFVLTLQSDTLAEGRSFPVPSGVSTARPRSESFWGDFNQFLFNQNFVVSADIFKGDTAFKPRELDFKITPVFNINYLKVYENQITDIDVRESTNRLDGFVGLQEASFEYHIVDLSPNYDFLTVIGGIQNFRSDFRGFLFNDNNMGVRFQGNYFSNRLQTNLVWFHQLEKDTNSDLNDYRFRNQNIFIANVFVQDFLSELSDNFAGYTFLVNYHYNMDLSNTFYDKNGNLVRPGIIGNVSDTLGHIHNDEVRVHYIGFGGDGHIGPVNITHQYYAALGRESYNTITGKAEDVIAQFFAAELSVDVDWLRFKGSFLWASGDRNPDSNKATGFDSIFDNQFFAGAGFSYWNRQAIPFPTTGVNLVQRLSVLPDLRSSKSQGKSNFVNPGLYLYNLGVSAKVTPKLSLDANVNLLFFDSTQVLEKVLTQSKIGSFIGVDYSLGVQYRPLLTDNIILTSGVGALTPGQGFSNIYTRQTLYSAFASLTFTY